VPASLARAYRLRALDGKLNLSEPSNIAKLEGWTIYTYKSTGSKFELKPGTSLTADVLRVGGGGSGGGGQNGGGGEAGEVIDQRDFEIIAGETDGDVVVGAGGERVMDHATSGSSGHESSFGGVVAVGGGYGGSTFNGPYSAWDPAENKSPANAYDGIGGGGGGGRVDISHAGEGGIGGRHGADGWGDYEPWMGYGWSGGGGAGAGWGGGLQNYEFNQTGQPTGNNPECGGHGVPCDIAGYGDQWEESLHTIRIVPWYGGGGQGQMQPGFTPPEAAVPGYGGGGGIATAPGTPTGWCDAHNLVLPGAPNTGGGGGGNGRFGWYDDPESIIHEGSFAGMTMCYGDAQGSEGGSGVVIIRIRTSDESKVAYPVIVGYDVDVPLYSDGVVVTRVGPDQPHTDESGDENCPFNGELGYE
jgi:hypothetical protein